VAEANVFEDDRFAVGVELSIATNEIINGVIIEAHSFLPVDSPQSTQRMPSKISKKTKFEIV
jgi:hypothetical protein